MAVVRRTTVVDLDSDAAFELWADTRRWATFVDGFGHVERVEGDWPHEGAKLVWHSTPAGRGRVTERVLTARRPALLRTQFYEERMNGTQAVEFRPAPDGGTEVALALDYTLTRGGPLRALTDALFIRRAQGDALARTLDRFRIEAAEQSAL